MAQTLSRLHVSPAKRCFYLFAVPRASFFTFRFCDPRAYSRGLSGCSVLCFLRAVRLAFLRSSLLSVAVFAMSAMVFLYVNLSSREGESLTPRNRRDLAISAVPTGLSHFAAHPGLTPWANIFRPSGAAFGFIFA